MNFYCATIDMKNKTPGAITEVLVIARDGIEARTKTKEAIGGEDADIRSVKKIKGIAFNRSNFSGCHVDLIK